MMLLVSFGAFAQQSNPDSQVEFGVIEGPIFVPSIADQIRNNTFIPADDDRDKKGHPKRKNRNNVIPGKGTSSSYVDPKMALQENAETFLNRAPLQTFDTTTNTATPSDPTGTVGPNHYLAAWNVAFRIFDKSGNALTPAANLSTIFPGNNLGDPIVFFDADVDNGPGEPKGRFVITEFDQSPNGFNVAVCQGPDPVNDGWHVYTTGFETGSFPDYTKFAVWADSYIVTANISNSNRVFAVERKEMIEGNAAQFVALPLPNLSTSGFYSPSAFHTTDDELAPDGTPAPIVYLQDDAWGGVSTDHLKVWNATIDWSNPANSSMSSPQIIDTTPFISVFDGGSFSNLKQPAGPDIDAMQATVMNQTQYRRFPDHNSAVLNFVIDVVSANGQGENEKAGIRWYELRQDSDGDDWEIYQEGTYTSPTGNKHAWAGSMAMNADGDIGLGYSTVSDTERIALQYTGRRASDPLNIMTAGENLIVQSTTNNTNSRYADYAHLTNDLTDGSFWHVSEYFQNGRRDMVGQFVIEPAGADDIGVISIDSPVDAGVYTLDEPIVISIRNFGTNDITDPEVQYIVNEEAAVVENYSGTIASGTTVSYTFDQTADLSAGGNFTIHTRTNLSGDTNPQNDPFKISVEGDGTLGTDTLPLSQSGITVVNLPNNQFNIELNTAYDGIMMFEVMNMGGQIVSFNNLYKEGAGYSYSLDMSYAATGVYLIRMGDQISNTYQTAKIIVK
ncbi:conserved repeat domain [unidentified eubacterium SCB49]|nr:conserved repeat domain [unidentified eubacterium SCB49]